MIASEDELSPLNSQKKVENFCSPIIFKLNDEEKCRKIFFAAVKVIENYGVSIEDKQALKYRGMTDKILDAYNGEKI